MVYPFPSPPPAPTPDTRPLTWADLPPTELYLWTHLAYHLTAAGCGDELMTTVKDLRYLVIKSHLLGTLAAEADLRTAEIHIPDNATLRLLRRGFAQSAHLLNKCKQLKDLAATLYSRTCHLQPLLASAHQLLQALPTPTITAAHPLPDLPHPALIRTLMEHAREIHSCAVSGDGRLVVSASQDGTLKVWEIETGTQLFTFTDSMWMVTDCAISADGRLIVFALGNGTLKVLDLQSRVEQTIRAGPEDRLLYCVISADGRTIVSSNFGEPLKVWDAESGAKRATLIGSSDAFDVAVNADGRVIASTHRGGTVKVWDAKNAVEQATLLAGYKTQGCAISADGRVIAVLCEHGSKLKLWDMEGKTERVILLGGSGGWPDYCSISADGQTIVLVRKDDGLLKVWDVATATEQATLVVDKLLAVHACATSADGRVFVSASKDGILRIWSIEETRRVQANSLVSWSRSEVWGCATSADGKVAATGSVDKTLKVWDVENGTERITIEHDDDVNSCGISADGRVIVSATLDSKRVTVWDTKRLWAKLIPLFGKNPSIVLNQNQRAILDCAVST